jgi:hypothetical protein
MSIGSLHGHIKLCHLIGLSLRVLRANLKLDAPAAHHAPPSQSNPNAPRSLLILFRQPQHTLPPKPPMCLAESAHLPMPRRVARKRKHPPVARLPRHQNRMPLRIIRLDASTCASASNHSAQSHSPTSGGN